MKHIKKIATLFLLCQVLSACDFFAKRRCEWYIMPDEANSHLIEKGWATVCLSNYEINRRRCFLKMKLSEAEASYGKKMRYVDVEVAKKGFPREILSYKACEK